MGGAPLSTRTQTADASDEGAESEQGHGPGIVIVFSGAPVLKVLPMRGARLLLGRDVDGFPDDDRVSRRHVEVVREGSALKVRDLGSRNGSFLGGAPLRDEAAVTTPAVLRLGKTVALVVADVHAYLGDVERDAGRVEGPTLGRAMAKLRRVAESGENVLVLGESGAGKEGAARAFHAAGPNHGGPLVAVNCATIPHGVAERLMFGARKGAFSGAENAVGYAQAADGGVLFLDELGELELDVQAKLLRLVETREVTALGSTTAKSIDLRFCFATHRDLRHAVANGKFRADLYHRIAQPSVVLPPLRQRLEDVSWLIDTSLQSIRRDLRAHVTFVEACLLRPWPGNVRELLQAVRGAADACLADGATVVRADHLDEGAGRAFAGADDDDEGEDGDDAGAAERAPVTRESLQAALAKHDGQIAAAARALGIQRTQVYRLLKKFGLEPRRDG
jgi:DNA-binding NtrC family response regulator